MPNDPTPPRRFPRRAGLTLLTPAVAFALVCAGCGNSEEGSVPKLRPRSEVEKDLGTRLLKPGTKVRKSQEGGGREG